MPLLGDGGQELSLVHAADLARALVAAGTNPATLGRVYHAAHPEPTTQRALAGLIARAVGRPARTVTLPAPFVRGVLTLVGRAFRTVGRVPRLDGDKAHELLARAWTCSSAALQRDTGWRAEIALGRGLEETARSYRRDGWL